MRPEDAGSIVELYARPRQPRSPQAPFIGRQHADLVDDSSGNRALEQRFATIAGLPLRSLTHYGGSAVTWETARFPGTSPFVVELPAGSLSPARVHRLVQAVLAVS